MGEEQCSKHDECIGRIHEDINKMAVSTAKQEGIVEGFTKSANEFIGAIRKDVYSPGGIVEKIGSHTQQIFLQWGLLAFLLLAVIVDFITRR